MTCCMNYDIHAFGNFDDFDDFDDVDEFEDISLDFQVRAMPTVVFLKNGDEVNRFVGARDESGIKEFIVNSMER